MALFRKLFYKKPPDGLLEICEHVYVFDCCFTIDAYEEENYKVYIKGIVSQLQDHFPEASFLVFNFREGETQSQMAEFLSDHDMTIMDYPRQYEGSPLLAMEVLHHFLRSCESWLSLGQNNFLLMHCERGGWPVMAFMLAALLLYRKQYCGEQKTLDMIYRQAPCELLQLLSPLNPMPSQLRYLQYISRRNVASEWPPLDRALTLDCVILRYIPNFDGEGGCRPIFRIYGQDPFLVADRNPKVLYSTPKRSKLVRHYKQKECPLVKIDINCHIQGDVVVECISLHNDMEREVMVFRVVFNTAFIRSNILMLNRDEVDTLWDAKELFPKEFRAEILFSEMDAASSIISMEFPTFEEKEGLPVEAFAKVHEIFSNVDWLDPRTDIAFNMLQQIGASNIILEKSDSEWNSTVALSPRLRRISPKKFQEETKLIVSPSSPRSPSFMSMRTQSTPLQRSSLDSKKNMEAKPQDSHFEPLSSSDVICQENNQSTTKPLVNDSVSCVPAVAANHSLAISHMQQAVETKSISILPQAQLSTAAVQHPPTSSVTKAPPNVPQPPPLPAPLSSASELARSSHVNETGTNLQHKDQPPLVDQAIAEKNSFPITTSTASSSTSSSAVAVNSTLPATLTPHLNEEPTIRGIPSTVTPPPPTTTSFRDLPQESPSSLEANFTPTITALAAPKPPIASPLNDIKVVQDGPIIFPPAPPTPPLPPSPSKAGVSVAPPPPPPPPPPPLAPSQAKVSMAPPPPPMPHLKETTATKSTPPPPPPPPSTSKQVESPTISSSAPPPPPPPGLALSSNSSHVPVAPSPPPPFGKKTNAIGGSTPAPPALSSPINSKNKLLSRTISSKNHPTKKLKPLHWLKLSRAVQGSLWAEAQKLGEASKPPEIDMSELENLFSAAAPCTDRGGKSSSRNTLGPKSDKVQLIDHRRAYNCEIMLSKVKVPLHDLMSSVLALEESALDVDQVDNLIKFCPTKEEMEVLKGYTGEMEKLGKCELFFLELMQVPRVESKLRVFSFKIQFRSQVSDLRKSLNVVNSATKEIRNSVKLKRIMQTILSLGNALNQGTARGSAIGFRLDSLLKLTETRARNNRMTLMHYLCKVVADKLPELLDFSKDVSSLEPASKIQLKFLAEEMQAISKGLEKVVQELSSSENDGHVSEKFREALKEFLCFAEAEVRSLASLYSGVGRNVDALILYFGEDPARCLFEQVISTLLNFVRMFNKAHEENCKQLEQDAKKSAENEKMKMNAPQKETGNLLRTSIESKQS